MKKHLKKISILMTLVITASYIYLKNTDALLSKNTEMNASTKSSNEVNKHTSKINTIKNTENNLRPTINFPDAIEVDATAFIWGEKLQAKLKEQLPGQNAEIKIFYLGDYKFNQGHKKINSKKAKIMIKNLDNNKKSNFFAFVDPYTGRILRTWGATRYENYLPSDDLKLTVSHFGK